MLRLASRWAAISMLVAMVTLTIFASAALADHRECTVISGVYVCWVVKDPQLPTTPNPPGAGGGDSVVCSWQGRMYPCHDDQFGWFDNADGCYYLPMTPQPAYDSKLGEGHPIGQGAIYQFMCPTWTGRAGGWKGRATSGRPADVNTDQLSRRGRPTLGEPRARRAAGVRWRGAAWVKRSGHRGTGRRGLRSVSALRALATKPSRQMRR